MYRVSEILSKPAVSLYEAKALGVVGNVLFDKKLTRARYLVVLCDDENDVEQKFIELTKVSALAGDAVTVDNLTRVVTRWEVPGGALDNPINRPVYNPAGKLLGRVTDCGFEAGKVTLFMGDETLDADGVLAVSNDLIVFNDGDKRVRLVPPRFPTRRDDRKVTAASPAPPRAAVSALPAPAPVEDAPPLPATEQAVDVPTRIPYENTNVMRTPPTANLSYHYGFLLNKRVTRRIVDSAGNVIADENARVTQEMIDRAKQNGKLVQLALHAM